MKQRNYRINKNDNINVYQKNSIDYRIYIVIFSCIWWLLVSVASRVEMSSLQIQWNNLAFICIFFYFPLCIAFGILPALVFPLKVPIKTFKLEVRMRNIIFRLFYLFIFLFLLQSLIYTPPVLSVDSSSARLEWGFKYIHVATEIFIRTGVLICVGSAIAIGRMSSKDLFLIFFAEVYAVSVVSRGLILEILIYFIFALILISYRKNYVFRLNIRHIFLLLMIWVLFFLYGEWRQGEEFSISEYGGMLVESNFLAWIFGYFFVNFDNLALIIMENFQNGSATNVFGPLLQTLQIIDYKEVDEYLYVGKFNLGTALRPFVIDYGPWFGGVTFGLLWSFVLLIPNLCRFSSTRFAILISLAYMSLLFPVTGRIEQPPYLFPLLILALLDLFYWIMGSYNFHNMPPKNS